MRILFLFFSNLLIMASEEEKSEFWDYWDSYAEEDNHDDVIIPTTDDVTQMDASDLFEWNYLSPPTDI